MKSVKECNKSLVHDNKDDLLKIMSKYGITEAIFYFSLVKINLYTNIEDYLERHKLCDEIKRFFINKYKVSFMLENVLPISFYGYEIELPESDECILFK